MPERVVIIGAGHAAGQCAASLRQKGWNDEIILVGEEVYPPYQRPPLSKVFLAGNLALERLFLKPEAFYEKERIELWLGSSVVAIDRAAKLIRLADGTDLHFTKLVVATGARVRRLPLPGAELPNIGYLRDIADVARLQPCLKPGARLGVIGAGYIGLEVAAVAAKMGLSVTVLESGGRVLGRVTSEAVSKFFQDLHHANGVDIRLGAHVTGFEGNAKVERILLEEDDDIECDFVVIGIGVLPNEEIAVEAGLPANNGICVDHYTQTEDPDIYAIGDCTRHPSNYSGEMIRLESVHNALEQAKTAAAAICGEPIVYDQVPWFWSDQYDVKLQAVGMFGDRYEAEIIRGDPSDKRFSVFYLKDQRLIAVDSINAPADHMIARRIIANGTAVSAKQISDPAFEMKSLIL